jgi:hypothetical protein
MLQMWVLKNHSNKINVYFVTLMQVFHIEFYGFEVFFSVITQHSQYVSNSYFQENFQQSININAMLTSKACKHNINLRLQLQYLYVLMQISHLPKKNQMSKKWKT